jgi:hypothetical protein
MHFFRLMPIEFLGEEACPLKRMITSTRVAQPKQAIPMELRSNHIFVLLIPGATDCPAFATFVPYRSVHQIAACFENILKIKRSLFYNDTVVEKLGERGQNKLSLALRFNFYHLDFNNLA